MLDVGCVVSLGVGGGGGGGGWCRRMPLASVNWRHCLLSCKFGTFIYLIAENCRGHQQHTILIVVSPVRDFQWDAFMSFVNHTLRRYVIKTEYVYGWYGRREVIDGLCTWFFASCTSNEVRYLGKLLKVLVEFSFYKWPLRWWWCGDGRRCPTDTSFN